MQADVGYHDYIMEVLAPIGDVTGRAMFGGYGIFHQGDMFAIIAGSTLYFKVNDTNRADYEAVGSKQFPHSMPYWEVPAEVIEDTAKLHKWARTSIVIGHATAKKKRRK